MFVKVCGLTSRADAEAAIDLGARAVGFIFHSRSPRYLDPAQANWIRSLPPDAWRVGVFVNRPKQEVEQVARDLELDIAQLHGDESPGDAPEGLRVWKAFRVNGALPEAAQSFPSEAVVLDGASSGRVFDWTLAGDLHRPFILAGGLTPDNVAGAIARTQPWGVDVNSGVESEPGKKDRIQLRRFLEACRA